MKRYLILIIIFMLFVVFELQVNAAKITDIRSYSESNKTRIVFQFDNLVQYHVKNTIESGILIYLLQTELDHREQAINVNSQQIKSITANEIVHGVLEIRILFKEKVLYDIFYLNSPFCIVIDILSTVNTVGIPGSIQLVNTDFDLLEHKNSENGGVITTSDDIGQGDKNHKNTNNSQYTKNKNSDNLFHYITQLLVEKYMLIHPYFNILFMIGIIAISIRIFYMNKFLKNNLINNRNQEFKNTMNNLEENLANENRDEKVKIPKNSKTLLKTEKKETKTDDIVQPDSHTKQYEKVYKLAELGLDRLAISKKSNIPIGEVNLILDLAQVKTHGKMN